MKEKTRSEIFDQIIYRAESCYQTCLNETALQTYQEAMAEYPIEDISAAFTVHIKKSKYFPTIAEIIAIIEKNHNPIQIESRSRVQWRQVVDSVRQRGLNRGAPRFADAVTDYLVKHEFNWRRLCEMTETEMHWEEKRWHESFAMAADLEHDLKRLEAPEKVMAMLEPIGGRPDTPSTPARITDAKGYLKSVQRVRSIGPVDREQRLAELKAQAKQLQEAEDGKN